MIIGEDNFCFPISDEIEVNLPSLDYDGFTIAYSTMTPGKVHDSLVDIYNRVQKNYWEQLALRDPGFQGVGYVVAGYRR